MVPNDGNECGARRSAKGRPSSLRTPVPIVVATAYPVYDTPNAAPVGVTPYAFVPVEATSLPQYSPVYQYPQVQAPQIIAPSPVIYSVPVGSAPAVNPHRPSPATYSPTPYTTPPLNTAAPALPSSNTNTYVSIHQATMEMTFRLCRIAIVLGGMMLLIGIILLASAPPRHCPDGCERNKCYIYNDDQHPSDESDRKIYDCSCIHSDGTESCRNPTHRVGSQGYYHLVFGVLGMVFGGLGFFGGAGTYQLLHYTENQRRNRIVHYGGAAPGYGNTGVAYGGAYR